MSKLERFGYDSLAGITVTRDGITIPAINLEKNPEALQTQEQKKSWRS